MNSTIATALNLPDSAMLVSEKLYTTYKVCKPYLKRFVIASFKTAKALLILTILLTVLAAIATYELGAKTRILLDDYVESCIEYPEPPAFFPVEVEPINAQFQVVADPWLLPLETLPIAPIQLAAKIKTSQLLLLPAAKEIESVTSSPYDDLTIRQLKDLASQRKLKAYGRMRRDELIEALMSA